jgi:peroxiredoxin
MASATTINSFYDLTPLNDVDQPFEFNTLKGKVVMVVNVASKCAFTGQYESLEELYKKYHNEGLEIIGFPCNQFGHGEAGTQEEIATFCQRNYGVTFPVLKKIDVNGSNTDPVYQYLKDQKSGLFGLTRIKWNFEKFIIDRNGNVVERYASTTSPSSIDSTIKKYLEE